MDLIFHPFGMEKGIEYTRDYFKRCLLDEESKVRGKSSQAVIVGQMV